MKRHSGSASGTSVQRLFKLVPARFLGRYLMVGLILAASACADSFTAPLRKSASGGPITIRHDYPLYSSWTEYIVAFNRMEETIASARRSTSYSAACGYDQLRAPTHGQTLPQTRATGSQNIAPKYYYTDEGYTLGAIHVYATRNYQGGYNYYAWEQLGLFFPVSSRFLPRACDWRYGKFTDNWEEEAIDDGYGTEHADDPPADAPAGMDQAEYDQLNPAEKSLVWKKFWTLSRDDFNAWVAKMRQIRARAEQWASETEPEGAHNGPQDALRHAYWQCSLAKNFGASEALAWGDAHEKYSPAADEARMDLWNNAVGRKMASMYPTCEEGVLAARSQGLLKLDLSPPPTSITPLTPPPTRPPLDS